MPNEEHTTTTHKWEQFDDEPPDLYARFVHFRLLGPRRTLQDAFLRECHTLGLDPKGRWKSHEWKVAAQKWNWQERASIWDDWMIAEDEKLMKLRRQQLIDAEFNTAMLAVDRVMAMLRHPIVQTVTKETKKDKGKTTNIVNIVAPAKWDLKDVTEIMKMASEIGRRSQGMSEGKKNTGIDLNLSNTSTNFIAETTKLLLGKDGEDEKSG